MIEHEMKTSNGLRFEWGEHRFALDPMSDMHPLQGIRKCAQVGFSEMMSCKADYLAIECNLSVGYTIHNAKAMDDFSKTKFDPIIAANPYLSSHITGNSSKKVVESSNGTKSYIHLVGAYNSASSNRQEESTVGISFTADVLIHDEDSRSDQYVINQLKSRILNSRHGYIWKFDNPLYPGFGADKVWQESDQMHYMVQCDHCKYWQYLDWYRLDKTSFVPNSYHCWIDPIDKQVLCGRCKGVISDEVRRTGVWQPRFKSKGGQYKNGDYFGYRGYWINQLMYIRHSVESMMLLEEGPDAMTPSVFSNMVLGKPYIGSDVTVTRQIILDNISRTANHEPIKGQVAMGVDQGNEKQWVLMDHAGMFAYGRSDSWEEIEMIRDQWNATIVMDADPETGAPKRICDKYAGRAWRAKFSPESDQRELAKFSPDSDRSLVLIRKHEMFDRLANDFNALQEKINMHTNELHEFADEWQNQVRIVSEDRNGNQRYEWVKTGKCDLPYAYLYAKIAMMKIGRGKSTIQKFGRADPAGYIQSPIQTPSSIINSFKKV
jgi:hypothetical protein